MRGRPSVLSLSICLIVRNEAALLPRCLESLSGVAEQIVVADTGSTDDTRRVAAAFGAQVLDVPWADDFSAARNRALAAATATWTMMLDADEWLPETAVAALRQILPQVPTDAVILGRRVAQDHGLTSIGPLIWPTALHLRFRGRIHEVLEYAHVPTLAEAPDIVVLNQRPGWQESGQTERTAFYGRLMALELAEPEPSVEVLLAAGGMATADGDHAGAAAHFQRALAHPNCFGPRQAMIELRLAEARLAQGDDATANGSVTAICRQWPEYLDAHVTAARLAARHHRWPVARSHWSSALRLLRYDRPQYLQRLTVTAGDMLAGYAEALEGLGDTAGLQACQEAILLDDGDRALLDELARRLQGDLIGAWQWYGELFAPPEWSADGRPQQDDPVDVALVYTTIAEFLWHRRGEAPDPGPLLERAARLCPDDPRPAEAMARFLTLQRRWPAAWQWINDVFARGGGDPRLELNRGLIAQKLGLLGDAREAFRRAAADEACRADAERLLTALGAPA